MKFKIDSRKIQQGDTFIAIKGYSTNGHDYIEDAIKNGATTIICEYGEYNVKTILVKDSKKYLEKLLQKKYLDNINKLNIIGVTGTNGKTTTCYLLYQALKKLNKKCAYIGTIGFYLDKKVKDLVNTTPDIYELYELLTECYINKIEYVVMEVSSHSLYFQRVKGISFDATFFTNLTQDHLDFHKTMDNYCYEKAKLFKQLKKQGLGIVNKDDSYHSMFKCNKCITIGENNSDYQILTFKTNMKKTIFKIKINNIKYNFKTKLLGKHNVYNLLFVIAFLDNIKISKKTIIKIVESLNEPVGRMECINYKKNKIIIDYAHTPDALDKILKTANSLKPRKLYTIIGCGGNRDKDKRSIMGDLSTNKSDLVIFTNDNPRTENPDTIINQMTSSLYKNNYKIIQKRDKAIEYGVQMLKKNDILLILGKGHEEYQLIGDECLPFSDKQIVINII